MKFSIRLLIFSFIVSSNVFSAEQLPTEDECKILREHGENLIGSEYAGSHFAVEIAWNDGGLPTDFISFDAGDINKCKSHKHNEADALRRVIFNKAPASLTKLDRLSFLYSQCIKAGHFKDQDNLLAKKKDIAMQLQKFKDCLAAQEKASAEKSKFDQMMSK